MLEWARAAEFDVPECHLHGLDDLDDEAAFLRIVRQLVEPGTRGLAIKRYDRTPDGPVHQEDFAQATGLPPAKKYEQIRVSAHRQAIQAHWDAVPLLRSAGDLG